MKTKKHDLAFVSDNRLLAEATAAALVNERVVESYAHIRFGFETEYLDSIVDQPAVVVLDSGSCPGLDNLFGGIRHFVAELPASRVVAIGDASSLECVAGCIEAGASTFILVNDSLEEVSATIRALKAGQPRCSRAVLEAVLQRIRQLSAAKHDSVQDRDEALTQREIEVLELVEKGMLNKEIARRLGLAISTVKNHLHAIFEKLNVTGRRQAVRHGIALGMLHCDREQNVA